MPADTLDYLIAPESYESPRVRLRGWLPGDGPLLAEAVRTSLEHLAPWMPWVEAVKSESPEQLEARYERYAREARGKTLLATEFILGVFSLDESRVLGSTGFHLRGQALADLSAEIGMWIRVDEAGKGLGTHVLECVLDWGFDAWPWQRLAWRCDTKNLASRRVAEKCGLHFEGITRSDLMSDLARSERRDSAWFSALRSERGKR